MTPSMSEVVDVEKHARLVPPHRPRPDGMEHLWRLRAFAFGSACRVISARWMWSRLWSFAFKTPAAASENVAGSATRVAL